MWSPDSRHIAFIDCLFDWIEKGIALSGGDPIGDETNRRCSIAIVSRTGQFHHLFPIGDSGNAQAIAISMLWEGPKRLSAQVGATNRKFRIPSY